MLSDPAIVTGISYRETKAGGTYAPHQAPTRQFVITLSGTLEFKTVPGATFVIRPGDRPDIVLIGAGIMSATFGTVLKKLAPSLDIAIYEALHDCAQESSDG